jgi:hypothetical protein
MPPPFIYGQLPPLFFRLVRGLVRGRVRGNLRPIYLFERLTRADLRLLVLRFVRLCIRFVDKRVGIYIYIYCRYYSSMTAGKAGTFSVILWRHKGQFI